MESFCEEITESNNYAHEYEVCNPANLQISEEHHNIKLSLLPSDHALLKKFQQSLKEFLLRTKAELSNEIAELKHNIKIKEQQRENNGAKIYEMQQEIQRQNDQLEEYALEIQDNLDRRRQEDDIVDKLKTKYETKNNLSKEHKANYNKRLVELNNLQNLDNNIRKWTEEVEDEVKNAKRLVSRDSQLQQQLSEEKKKSDMMFFNLDIEVKKREKELLIVEEELRSQRKVIEVLNQSICHANADLEVLQSEHKRLTQSWNEVIVAIQHRDKIIHQVYNAKGKEKEFIKLCISSIEAIKKQITRELDKNDKLQLFKTRLANDFSNLKRECQRESETLAKLETKLSELPLWLEQTEKDLNEARREGNQLEIELRRIQWKIDKQHNKKFQIEEYILKLAQEQLITDKASEYRFKLLHNAQEQRRSLELNLAHSENLLAETLLEIEKLKGLLLKLHQDNERLKTKLSTTENKSDLLNFELRTIEKQIEMKMKRIDMLTKQLDPLLKTADGFESSPTERKIKLLEKTLQSAEQQIREHQQFWLILQNHFVNLSQKRNNQLKELQVTRKQLSIIKQKSLKIDNDLENSATTTRGLNRDIQTFTTKVEMLNEKVFNKTKRHETNENEGEIEHFKLIQILKENEIKILELEDEINLLQAEIEHHKNIVLDYHREALSWETKYKLIEETLRLRKGEENFKGEIGYMRKEIHRMEIRYNQLKKAQERLVQDLELCVMHREQIFLAASTKQRADAKEKRSKLSITVKQKVSDLKNKLNQVNSEMRTLTEEELIVINNEHEANIRVSKNIQENIQKITTDDNLVRAEIEECSLLKYRNLDLLVRKQNRGKAYRRLNNLDFAIKLPRSESIIQNNMDKQIEINLNLGDTLQAMMDEFSSNKTFFLKILQYVKKY